MARLQEKNEKNKAKAAECCERDVHAGNKKNGDALRKVRYDHHRNLDFCMDMQHSRDSVKPDDVFLLDAVMDSLMQDLIRHTAPAACVPVPQNLRGAVR